MSVHLSWITGRILQEDIELLAQPCGWLNDSCVAYFMQWLSLILDLSPSPTACKATGFVLMDPCAGFMLQHEEDVDDIDLDSVGLDPANQFIFLPVNNGDICAESYSGTHWSLLVWAPYGKLYTFDSSGSTNAASVKATARGLVKYFLHCSTSAKIILPERVAQVLQASTDVISVACPQQQNGYDCGIFVCAFTEFLVSTLRRVAAGASDARSLETAFDSACKGMLENVSQSGMSRRRQSIHDSLFAAETKEMLRKVSAS
jgi:Ulp1 family protease